jgi:hypothetical protein
VIDWAWPFAYDWHDQPLTQASCLWRAKWRYKWIGMNDIDEIFVSMEGRTVADVLTRYEPVADKIGAIVCCNR